MTMTMKDYVSAIHKSQLLGPVSQDTVLSIILREAGFSAGKNGLDSSTYRRWIDGSRKFKHTKYFPNGNIKSEDLFEKFRGNNPEKIYGLQKLFADMSDTESTIDTETTNLDLFCWTLVNQFLDLVGLKRIDIQKSILEYGRSSTGIENNISCKSNSVPQTTENIDALYRSDPQESETESVQNINKVSVLIDKSTNMLSLKAPSNICYKCKSTLNLSMVATKDGAFMAKVEFSIGETTFWGFTSPEKWRSKSELNRIICGKGSMPLTAWFKIRTHEGNCLEIQFVMIGIVYE